MNYEFYVITHTPDLFKDGNLADEFGYTYTDVESGDKFIVVGTPSSFITHDNPSCEIKVTVFEVGEIVICDCSGREVCYPGRKPSKWDVEYEVFDNLDDAVKRAQELL